MRKKIYVGMMAIAILSLLLLSGCGIGEKQKCIESGGDWHSGYTGVGGSSGGWCGCPFVETEGASEGQIVIEHCADKSICLPNNGGCSISF